MSNLPQWRGADRVYSRAYKVLNKMGKSNVSESKGRKRRGKPRQRVVSEDMTNLIEALNHGNEEQLKGLLAQYMNRFGFVSAAV